MVWKGRANECAIHYGNPADCLPHNYESPMHNIDDEHVFHKCTWQLHEIYRSIVIKRKEIKRERKRIKRIYIIGHFGFFDATVVFMDTMYHLKKSISILAGIFSYVIIHENSFAIKASYVFFSNSKNKEMLIVILNKFLQVETVTVLQVKMDAGTIIMPVVH